VFDCTKLTDYVTETWIEGRFSQPTWNHYQTEGPRTNNHLEGWHNKLKKRFGIAHPTPVVNSVSSVASLVSISWYFFALLRLCPPFEYCPIFTSTN
jgi:hypothetical protein